MRIGFIGNANNYPFMLAQAMRKLGHEVSFIVTSTSPLDRPENRYSDISYPYPEWIYDLSPMHIHDYMFFSFRKRNRIASILRDCDAVIANEFGPMLLSDMDLPSIAMLTGTDLETYANFNTYDAYSIFNRTPAILRPALKWFISLCLTQPQRAGIHAAAGVIYFPRGILPSSDRLLDDIGIEEERRIFNLMTDIDSFDYCPPQYNMPLRVFCGARLSWSSLMPERGIELNYKGTEIMIRGVAMFLRDFCVPLEMRLVKKGTHVKETMKLIEDEGLAEHVIWLDEMSQKQINDEYRQADIVFDQLGRGSIGMVSLDAMAMGRPVIANARPEILEPLLGVRSPICQARTPQEVSQQISYLYFNPNDRVRIGLESRKYVEQYFSSIELAKRCLQRIALQSTN